MYYFVKGEDVVIFVVVTVVGWVSKKDGHKVEIELEERKKRE